MFRSLYSKLSAVLLGLFAVIGLLAIVLIISSTGLYQQEVNQKLNRELAAHIVAEKTLIRDKLVNQGALEEVFHMMMVINPVIELYLLDPAGKVLAYSAEPGKVKRDAVDLAPIQSLLSGTPTLPLFGDDPRDVERKKVFSAARVVTDGRDEGYLYIVLGGEEYDSVVDGLAQSHILSVSAWIIAGALVAGLVAGLLLFALLMRKLKRLAHAMAVFKAGEVPPLTIARADGDEICRLTSTFQSMAQQIQEQMSAIRKTDTMRRELVANVSHDLRTPLATLQGYVETLLLKDAALSPEERRRYLEIAILHCKRLNKLVGELFELAKLDARDTNMHCEVFSLSELAQDIIQKFQLPASEKGILISASFPRDLPFVYADIGLVERALENLIENALRYTPKGGSIELALTPAEHGVTVQVKDTGCGIPQDELPRIFDRFYQLEKSRNSNPGSSGLGLAIAKRILELHGSRIEVQSALEKGTSFSFLLPAQGAA